MIKLSKLVSKNSTKIKNQKKKRKGKETHYKKVFLAGINYAKSKLIAKNKIEQIILLYCYIYEHRSYKESTRASAFRICLVTRLQSPPNRLQASQLDGGLDHTEPPRSDLTLTLTFLFETISGFCGLWQRLLSRPRCAQLDSLRPERR